MKEEKLNRIIGRWDLTAIAINTIIGAGIFGLPSKVFEKIGSWSLLAYIFCAVVIGLIVLCFAEVSSRFQRTGGMYLYAKESFGSVVGFETGWLYWLVRVATFAANCNLMLAYLSFFIPSADQGYLRIVLILLTVSAFASINIVGVKQSVLITNIFTIGKILPLLVFVFVGVFFIEPKNFSFGEMPNYESFSTAALLLIYAYVGFEAAVIPAGETKKPQSDMPFALLTALIFSATLFFLIQLVAIGTFAPNLSTSERPLADAAANFMGYFGAAFIAIGAIISILGNLNGGFLTASRLPFAMAVENELPEIFAKTHEKFKTPYISIILTASVVLFLTIQSSFISAVAMATITRLLVYATTCLSLLIFRYRNRVGNQNSETSKSTFKAPFGILVSVLSIVLIFYLLSNIKFEEIRNLFVFAIVGLVVYLANLVFRKI
ncbi:MAG: APC family permease [Acidobacteria bacterium]|jgi:amino acid transporter|nr:MAG: APC family permease [Acidobacteriota bacterium]GIU82190.1 MAG: amino acid permease [Pyrinomonadaceae bacterium]